MTCFVTMTMSVMIQIRNVPSHLHRRLKARAAMAGMSLSEFLLREIERVAERPSLEELRERLARRSVAALDPPAAEVIREDRDRR